MKTKHCILTITIMLSTLAKASNDTCLDVYRHNAIKSNLLICNFSPIGLAGVNDFAGIPLTATTLAPITTPVCLATVSDYKKSKQLIEQGLVGDGLLLREVAAKNKIEITQLSKRIADFNNKTMLCQVDQLMSFSELVQFLIY